MNRCFDINLLDAAGWTEGEEWGDSNPAQSFGSVYHRIYSASADEPEPNYRVEPGDNFLFGAVSTIVRDWTPQTTPWNIDIDGTDSAGYTFYFGLQKGESGIDTNLDLHAPYIVNHAGEVFNLSASHYSYVGIKAKDSDPIIKLSAAVEDITVKNAVLINTPLIDSAGYSMNGWILRNITWIGLVANKFSIPLASSNVSLQDISRYGEGDCGLFVADGHSEIEIIALTVENENHQFAETGELCYGLEIGTGDTATVRYTHMNGFSGTAFHFDCPVDVKGLSTDKSGAGFYFSENSVARELMVTFTRQVSGDTWGFRAAKSLELTNGGCNLDETSGLGVFVGEAGSTITLNGGDYQFKIPLPFITALGSCTLVLNNVTINGTLYNETIELVNGESWRGVKAPLAVETIPVYNNALHFQPYVHIPLLRDAVSVQGNNEPFNSVIDLPSGAKVAVTGVGSLRYDPCEAFLHLDPNETAVDYLRYSTEDNIYMHQFVINASPEVGEKVVQPDGFLAGTGWTQDGDTYTADDTDSSISATYSFEEGEVYQISLNIAELGLGNVKPKIGSAEGQYSHSILGTEVWLIRAPANANTIEIVGETFTGSISNIYVRKLLRTETPAVPELEYSVDGNEVTLEWFIEPVERITDTKTPRVTKTGELASSAKNGYYDNDGGVYLFEDCYSHGRKTAINLRGGEALEVYKLWVTGGYRGEHEKWQNALAVENNSGPYFETIQACYVKCDLELDSSRGSYTSQFGNSDVLVFNGLTNEETFAARAYVLGMHGENSTDGVIDTKKRTEVNHSTFINGYRQLRVQNVGTSLATNCNFTREINTKEAIAPTAPFSLVNLWNCYVDGTRCVELEQMAEMKRPDSGFPDVGAVGLNAWSVSVLKTYPTINDLCRVAMTDMEFEVSTDSGSTWSTLNVPDVGLPGVIGSFLRTINFSSGTYHVRCRCLNGALIGAWSNTVSITV